MPGVLRGGRRRSRRHEAYKAKMRGQVLVMMLAAGALVAVLVAGAARLMGSP